jgi:hypothetical protein
MAFHPVVQIGIFLLAAEGLSDYDSRPLEVEPWTS